MRCSFVIFNLPSNLSKKFNNPSINPLCASAIFNDIKLLINNE